IQLIRTLFFFFFSSRRRHTRSTRDWSSDVCSSDLSGSTFATLSTRWAPLLQNPSGPTGPNFSSFIPVCWQGLPRRGGIAAPEIRSEERRVGKECRAWGSRYE